MIAQRMAQCYPDYIRNDLLISTLLHERVVPAAWLDI
jgi:hypothetical protein